MEFCFLLFCFVVELWLVQITDMALFNAEKPDLPYEITEWSHPFLLAFLPHFVQGRTGSFAFYLSEM